MLPDGAHFRAVAGGKIGLARRSERAKSTGFEFEMGDGGDELDRRFKRAAA